MIAKKLKFEPYQNDFPWCAIGVLGHRYWARDNGLWDSDPNNSDAHADDVVSSQRTEDKRVLDCLSPEAIKAVEKLITIAP